MIRVDRNLVVAPALDPPRKSDGKTELQRAREHMSGSGRDTSFDFSAYKAAAAKVAMDQMFHGKCAYCESYYAKTQPVDVEHYRPKGAVENISGHGGYWWLAMVWSNLLPSCIDCNRRREQRTPSASAPSMVRLAVEGDTNRWRKLSTGKASAFPLADEGSRAAREQDDYENEKRLLLDPTRDDPAAHIGFYVDRANLVSVVYPMPTNAGAAPILPKPTVAAGALQIDAAAAGVSAMGAVSIQIYGLNRLALVQARTRVLRDLEFMLELLIGLEEIEAEIDERIEGRRVALGLAPGGVPADDEFAFLARIKPKVGAHSELIRTQLQGMLVPTAPYSALARAWTLAFIQDNG